MSSADKNQFLSKSSLSENIMEYQQSAGTANIQTKNPAPLVDHEENQKNTQSSHSAGSDEIEKRHEVKPLVRTLLKPLAPLAPKKQILPKLLPAQSKNNVKNSVNTSKQWVLPPRPRPGRKSTENTPTPSSNVTSPQADSFSPPPQINNFQASSALPVAINKKKTKIRKTVKPKKTAPDQKLVAADSMPDESGNFELTLQLQSATEENENLRKIINKLNREIDLLKLVKLENKTRSVSELLSVPEAVSNNNMINDLSTTIDPIKINYNLKSKRLKRFNSESGYNSGIGLNGNLLDDVGFYNADTLMPSDLLLSNPARDSGSSLETLVNGNNNNKVKRQIIKPVKLEKSLSTPINSNILNNLDLTNASSSLKNELCGFCSNGSPCVCYESTLDLLQSREVSINLPRVNHNSYNNNIVKIEESPQLPSPPRAAASKIPPSRFSRTTNIIGDLGKNFVKNEMDVDMSFFVKPEEQDADDFMMI